MKDKDMIAAMLTMAYYSGRSAMSLPQVIATYIEMKDLLAKQAGPKKKK